MKAKFYACLLRGVLHQAGAPGQYTRDAWWRDQCRRRGWDNIHRKGKKS